MVDIAEYAAELLLKTRQAREYEGRAKFDAMLGELAKAHMALTNRTKKVAPMIITAALIHFQNVLALGDQAEDQT